METGPAEVRKEIFRTVTKSIKKKLKTKGIEEEDILKDFENFRKSLKSVKS